MKWLRDAISHWMGWETYEEAVHRIHLEMERDYPLAQQIKDIEAYNRIAIELKEVRRKALDCDGEYERGEPGLQ